jgi:hypothetical protein
MPGYPGEPVVTNARAYYHTTRGCGCDGHPAFPAPSVFEGCDDGNNSGAMRRENADSYPGFRARCFASPQNDNRNAFLPLSDTGEQPYNSDNKKGLP